MPKIVRNEIDYSSTTSTANQISYLNNTSGLSATNVQGAVDEVNSKVTEIGNLRCYQVGGNDTSFTFTHPNLSEWGVNYPHNIIVMGYKCYAFMNFAAVDSVVYVYSLGDIVLSSTKSANTLEITINASGTVWGGLRIICVD